MNIEGAWKVEMLGPYGWEKVSTAFLQGGRYLAAGADHHSVGSYEDADDTLKVNVRVMQHGESRRPARLRMVLPAQLRGICHG